MASFPTAIKSFTTKVDGAGKIVYAAYVNDLQSEVVAIETAIITGPLPIRGVSYTWPAADGSAGNALLTNGAGTLSWAVGPAKVFLQWDALGNRPPATAYATPDTRNAHAVLDFDGTTDEEAIFAGVLPVAYASGGLTIELYIAFTTATTGSAHFQASIERIDASSLDIDADSFAAFNESAAITAPATCGMVVKTTITFTDGADMDSLAAGEAFRLKIRRDADGTGGTDDINTDCELIRCVLRET